MFSLISAAHAQDASGGGFASAGASVLQILPIVLIFGVFYFLMIRPQQQQQKTLRAKLAAIKRGDKVLTAGGIVATVQKSREGSNEVEVEIAPNVRVVVLRDTITQVMSPSTPAAANDSK